ncbi:MAG: pyridoxamine 5'-phosphate oxidase family protein [Gemmatimonadota bacterium]
MTTATRFTSLDRTSSLAILARHNVGRLAFTFRDRADIQPLNYVFDEQWLYGRTQVGSKLVQLAHNRWCAFEVDEVRGMFDWDSVVVRGSFEDLDPERGSSDAYLRGVELLESLCPGILTADDPAPSRLILFRIHIDEVTGRSARPGSDE